MIDKDIKTFFSTHGDINELFVKEMDEFKRNERTPLSVYWLKKYRPGIYSESFKKIFFSYVETSLLSPELVTNNEKIVKLGPRVLFYHFDEIIHSFDDLSIYCAADKIIIPLMQHIGKKTAEARYDESTQYIEMLHRLVTRGKVYDLFKDIKLWKSTTHEIEGLNNIFLLPNKIVFKSYPIFDDFFKPFLYKNEDLYCSFTYKIDDIRGLIYKFDTVTKRNNEFMFDIISYLIKQDKIIRNNFILYLREKYVENKDKLKTVYDKSKIISDGFAVNFNYFLLLLCDGIIRKNIRSFDLDFFINEEYFLAQEDFKNDSKPQEEKEFNLQTSVFLSKIIFLNYSYNKLMENYRELEMKIEYSESENAKMAAETYLIAYRMIFSSNIFKEEGRFLKYFSQYLLDNSCNTNIPDLAYNCYFNAVEYLGHFLGSFDVSKDLINKFIFKKLDLVKVIYYNFSSYDINILIQLYVILENKDTEQRNELRFYLTNLIVNTQNFDKTNLDELVVIRFYSYVMNELEGMIGKIVSAILTLKRKMKETTEETSEIIRLKNEIDHRIKALKSIFDLIDIIDLNIYMNSNLLSQFSSVINLNLKRLIGPSCNELSTKEINVKVDFKEILRRVLKIYTRMSKEEIFIKTLVHDKINFNVNLLKRAYEISSKKYILNQDELASLNELINKINETITQTNTVEEIVPDEFVDPLTCVMMEIPVILNGSKVVIDKSTYDMLVIGQMNDPFNREELTGYIFDEELKKKIDQFKETKLNKF